MFRIFRHQSDLWKMYGILCFDRGVLAERWGGKPPKTKASLFHLRSSQPLTWALVERLWPDWVTGSDLEPGPGDPMTWPGPLACPPECGDVGDSDFLCICIKWAEQIVTSGLESFQASGRREGTVGRFMVEVTLGAAGHRELPQPSLGDKSGPCKNL